MFPNQHWRNILFWNGRNGCLLLSYHSFIQPSFPNCSRIVSFANLKSLRKKVIYISDILLGKFTKWLTYLLDTHPPITWIYPASQIQTVATQIWTGSVHDSVILQCPPYFAASIFDITRSKKAIWNKRRTMIIHTYVRSNVSSMFVICCTLILVAVAQREGARSATRRYCVRSRRCHRTIVI